MPIKGPDASTGYRSVTDNVLDQRSNFVDCCGEFFVITTLGCILKGLEDSVQTTWHGAVSKFSGEWHTNKGHSSEISSSE